MRNNKLKTSIDNFQKVLTEQIGMELSHIRKEKGLSGKDLAKKLKVSQQQISRYERGVCGLSCGMLYLILYYLEFSPCQFFNTLELKLSKKYPDYKFIAHNINNDILFFNQMNADSNFNKQTETILNSLCKR
ncbi:TPA: helix-turn-helix transcriptional regulator [Providencia rettgeri]|nr:helix-turn-helix transcriptional regulator [Providencia rettgeri]